MNARELYDYILENFNLGGTAARLVDNILQYIEGQGFVDEEDAHCHLSSLLDGFGMEEHEFKLYRAPECETCGKYAPENVNVRNRIECQACADAWEREPAEEYQPDSVYQDKAGTRYTIKHLPDLKIYHMIRLQSNGSTISNATVVFEDWIDELELVGTREEVYGNE
jgi:hypothetical protein